MAITYPSVHLEASFGVNGGTTGSLNTTGCDLLFVAVGSEAANAVTLTDSKSNTWHALSTDTSGVHVNCWYAYNAIVGSGHTFTASGSAIYCSIAVAGFAGTLTASDPFDQQNHSATVSGTTIQPGSVTPGSDNQILITGVGWNTTGGTFTVNSSFSITGQQDYVAATSYGVAIGYLIETTAAAKNPTWTRGSGSNGNQAVIGTFKASAAAGVAIPVLDRQYRTRRG